MSIVINCVCGKRLSVDFILDSEADGVGEVEPCPDCIEDARKTGYDNGYDKGYEEGADNNVK